MVSVLLGRGAHRATLTSKELEEIHEAVSIVWQTEAKMSSSLPRSEVGTSRCATMLSMGASPVPPATMRIGRSGLRR